MKYLYTKLVPKKFIHYERKELDVLGGMQICTHTNCGLCWNTL